jgi:hypothetical protein
MSVHHGEITRNETPSTTMNFWMVLRLRISNVLCQFPESSPSVPKVEEDSKEIRTILWPSILRLLWVRQSIIGGWPKIEEKTQLVRISKE